VISDQELPVRRLKSCKQQVPKDNRKGLGFGSHSDGLVTMEYGVLKSIQAGRVQYGQSLRSHQGGAEPLGKSSKQGGVIPPGSCC